MTVKGADRFITATNLAPLSHLPAVTSPELLLAKEASVMKPSIVPPTTAAPEYPEVHVEPSPFLSKFFNESVCATAGPVVLTAFPAPRL